LETTEKNAESSEITNEEMAETVTNIVFDFCQEKIENDQKFTDAEIIKIKSALNDFFISHPICSITQDKLNLLLDRRYADTMANELLGLFYDKLNGRPKTMITLAGKKGARRAITR
jgi:hypothetical protein